MRIRVDRHRRSRRCVVVTLATAAAASFAAASMPPPGAAVVQRAASPPAASASPHMSPFRQVNLVSDLKGFAQLRDRDVKNPWGIAFGEDTPLWVSNNFSPAFDEAHPRPEDLITHITVYVGGNHSQPITKVPLEVKASAPTGMVFNPTEHFVVRRNGARAPSRFLWDELTFKNSPNHVISDVTGWSPDVPPLGRGVVKVERPGAVDLGITLARGRMGPRLLVANTAAGGVDVYDGRFRRVHHAGAFVDPHGAGLAPYNVAVLWGKVYVSYVSETSDAYAINVFSKRGRFIKRLVTGEPLDDPWGMAIAPPHWGGVGGDLLVGNVDSGEIDAFNRHTGAFDGALSDRNGDPLVNAGLWGLKFGNGVIGTPRTLLFAAGIGDRAGRHVYEHGLIGSIRPAHP